MFPGKRSIAVVITPRRLESALPSRRERGRVLRRDLSQRRRTALGDRAGTCIDATTQIVEGRTLCLVGCQRGPNPVYLRWKGRDQGTSGELYVRSGPETVRPRAMDADKYIATRFPSK